MAMFEACYAWMMDNEDAGRRCENVPDLPGQWDETITPHMWTGARAISGINSHVFPEAFEKIAALEAKDRPLAVEAFYRAEFWNRWYDQMSADEVAKRVLDAAVNMGPGTAVKILQKAIVATGKTLTVDGRNGPETVAAANACGLGLVAPYKNARCDAYRAIVAAHPEKAAMLPLWLARAMK